MSDNLPMAGHYRKEFGETLKKLMVVMYGMGVEPGKIRMERAHKPTHHNRAQFDILVRADDGTMEYLYEAKTIEELVQVAETFDFAKEFLLMGLEKGTVTMTEEALFRQPGETNVQLALGGSFTPDFAAQIMSGVANTNSRPMMQRAASQVTPVNRPKDPKRIAAGRKASAKRYAPPPGAYLGAGQSQPPKV